MATKRKLSEGIKVDVDGQAEAHLRFAPDILARLGEELIPDPDQGIIELVKNAYDANARRCEVTLLDCEQPGGTVIVSDNGDGMTRTDIVDGWLVVGRSAKEEQTVSRLGRTPVGDKGLGRLAALRLGSRTSLRTTTRGRKRATYHVDIDWSKFDSARAVEDVGIDVRQEASTDARSGTEVRMEELNVSLGKRDVERLARSLLLLADPFDSNSSFKPILHSDEYFKLERIVQTGYLEYADFRVEAALSDEGSGSATVYDGSGRERWRAEHSDIAGATTAYKAPALRFEAWIYLLEATRYTRRPVRLNDVRKWLRTLGGVHVYLHGIRVRPYGDEGHDWLDLNLARTRNPELRPSTNSMIGRVIIENPETVLLEKTDRTGFIESDQFRDMRRFIQDTMEWLAAERVAERDRTKKREKHITSTRTARARKNLAKVVESLPPRYRKEMDSTISRFIKTQEKQTQELRADIQLYRTMATVGTTIAVFAHDSATPIRNLKQNLETIERRIGADLKTETVESRFNGPIKTATRALKTLEGFAALPLHLLEREKRRIRSVELNAVVEHTVAMFSYLERAYKAKFASEPADAPTSVRASEAAIESITVNLMTNALAALTSPDASVKERRISMRVEVSQDRVTIRALDSGPGIRMRLSDIWLPGRTTTEFGSGIGLTIVRDISLELGGEVGAIANGELGGAEVWVSLPNEPVK